MIEKELDVYGNRDVFFAFNDEEDIKERVSQFEFEQSKFDLNNDELSPEEDMKIKMWALRTCDTEQEKAFRIEQTKIAPAKGATTKELFTKIIGDAGGNVDSVFEFNEIRYSISFSIGKNRIRIISDNHFLDYDGNYFMTQWGYDQLIKKIKKASKKKSQEKQ